MKRLKLNVSIFFSTLWLFKSFCLFDRFQIVFKISELKQTHSGDFNIPFLVCQAGELKL